MRASCRRGRPAGRKSASKRPALFLTSIIIRIITIILLGNLEDMVFDALGKYKLRYRYSIVIILAVKEGVIQKKKSFRFYF